MNQFVGMNIGEVQQLEQMLKAKAGEINGIMQQLTGALSSTTWVGNDRQMFESDWQSTHVPALNNVCSALESAATRANANWNAQQTTSANG